MLCLVLLNSPTYAEETWTTIQPSYREVSLTGFSRARHEMTLSTEVSGKVKQVLVDVGDVISKNGNVSCLDDTFTKIDIRSTNNDIKQAKIDVLYYQKQVKRYQELVIKKGVSISQLDEMQRLLGTSERTELSKKLLKQRQQETLNRHCIKSPLGWIVDERYVEEGQWIDIGNPVVKVGNYSKLLVPFALSVNELNALKKQWRNISVWLPEYNQEVSAIIERVSPAFDESSRKIQVDLLLEKNLPVQRGGLRVDLKLKIPDSSNIFLIASNALDKRFEEIRLKRKDGQSLRIELLGKTEDGQVRITSPELKAGDQFKIIHP
ncbi:MAG: efflux RND transporter periplasmic adaptor subunit [Methylococcales bacterium]|nr:efflux RND transporter periplasmic adaptor subunit [Methylococcales bacterium]